MRLASHLGMSLDEVKAKTSATQYVLWMEYLEWEINAFDKQCYYLAQIAAEVRRSCVKPGVLVRLQDFLIKFRTTMTPQKAPTSTKSRTETGRTKQFFFGLTGLLGKGKKYVPKRK